MSELKRGDRIPGSRYYRSFCARCQEPMRVVKAALDGPVWCRECDPPHVGVGNPHTTSDDHDQGGYASIAERSLEEAR